MFFLCFVGALSCQGTGASAGPSQCDLHVDAWTRGNTDAEAGAGAGAAAKRKRGPGGSGGPGSAGGGSGGGAGGGSEDLREEKL